jgi:hypothetical protein
MRLELTTSVVIDTDCIGSCKSNYHTITTMTAPLKIGILSCLQTAIVCGLLKVEIILCRFFLLFIYVCVAIGDSIFKKEREG